MITGSIASPGRRNVRRVVARVLGELAHDDAWDVIESARTITEEVQISPPFLGWLFQFTGDMKLVSPRDVIERYTNKCASICGFESLAE